MIGSVDFADLDADVFGCVRFSERDSAGWLSTTGGPIERLTVVGSPPSLVLSGHGGFELALEPLVGPADFATGQEWLCRGAGRAGSQELTCLARVGTSAGASDGAARRRVSVLLRPDLAFICHASGADPEAGQLESFILRGDGPPSRVDDPRLSTAYGPDGSHNRAGIELWETDDSEVPLRLAAERVARAEFELGQTQFDCAFMRWVHGREVGAGCYELVGPAQ